MCQALEWAGKEHCKASGHGCMKTGMVNMTRMAFKRRASLC